MIHHYWNIFEELLASPFENIRFIWGIVPLYFALMINEMTSSKANFRTALQTGFSLLWAGAQWLYPAIRFHLLRPHVGVAMPAINLLVTCVVLAFGLLALLSGLMHHFPKYCSFLGHTRFSSYFMITMYPMQSGELLWSWERLWAIALFAVPIWLLLHFGLMPLRK
jgi:hypothetical protein